MSVKQLKLKLSVYKFVDLVDLIKDKDKFVKTKFYEDVPLCVNFKFYDRFDRYILSDKLHKSDDSIRNFIYYTNPEYNGLHKSDPTNVKVGLSKSQYEIYISLINKKIESFNNESKNIESDKKLINNDIKKNINTQVKSDFLDDLEYSLIKKNTKELENINKEQMEIKRNQIVDIKKVYKFVDLTDLIKNKDKFDHTFNGLIPICMNFIYSPKFEKYLTCDQFIKTYCNIYYLIMITESSYNGNYKSSPINVKIGFSKEQYEIYISLINKKISVESKYVSIVDTINLLNKEESKNNTKTIENGFYYNYKHTDDNIFNNAYKVIGIAHNTEIEDFNQSALVIYHPLDKNAKVYQEGKQFDAKPLDLFMKYISTEKKRFTKITDTNIISQLEKLYDQLYGENKINENKMKDEESNKIKELNKQKKLDEEFDHVFD